MPWLWQPAGAASGAPLTPKAIVPSEGLANIIPNSKTATTRDIDRTMTRARMSPDYVPVILMRSSSGRR